MIRRRAYCLSFLVLPAVLCGGVAEAADGGNGVVRARYALGAAESAPLKGRFALTDSTVSAPHFPPAARSKYSLSTARVLRAGAAKAAGDVCALDDGIFNNGFEP